MQCLFALALLASLQTSSATQLAPRNALADSSGATLMVAAADATQREKQSADWTCDGSADEVQLQAALDSLDGSGGRLLLSSGTFQLDAAVALRGRVHLTGQGKASVLRATSAFQSGLGVLDGSYDGSGNPLDLTTISDVVVDGARYTGALAAGIHLRIDSKLGFQFGSPDAHLVIRDVLIAHTAGHGLHMEGSFNRAARVSRVRVWNVEGDGFRIESPDGHYTDCDTGSSAGYGFTLSSANNFLTGCKAWYADQSGFLVDAVRSTLTGCTAQDNQAHGFLIQAGMTTLTGCHADSNSYLGSGSLPDPNQGLFDGFHLDASNVTLSACFAYDKSETGHGRNQRYGTYVTAGKQRLNLQVANGSTPGSGSHNNFVGGIGGALTGSGTRIVATGQDEFVSP